MTAATAPHWRRRAVGWAIWVVALGALAQVALLLVARDNVGTAAGIVRPGWLILAVLLAFVPWLTNIARLLMWSAFVGAPLTARAAARVFLGSIVGTAVTPTATGAPLIKAGLLAHEGVRPATAVSLVTLQAIEDVTVIALAVPAALWISRGSVQMVLPRVALPVPDAGVLAAAFVVVMVLIPLIGLWPGARKIRSRTIEAARVVRDDAVATARMIGRRGRARLIAGLAMAAIQWGARWGAVVAVLAAFGSPMAPLLAWALQWGVFALSSFVPTPGGIGGIEAAFALLYAPFLPLATLAAVLAVWRLILFFGPIALAAALLLMLQGEPRPVAPRDAPRA